MRVLSTISIVFFSFIIFLNYASADACECYCYDQNNNPVWVNSDSSGQCSQPCSSPYQGWSYCGASAGQNYQGLPGSTGSVKLDDPLGGATPQTLIGKVIAAALGLVGSLALAMFIYGGFMWMTAMGNPEKVKKGRDTMLWAVLGLVIIFSAYGLIKFVLTNALQIKQ